MIVIKRIDFIETDQDPFEILSSTAPNHYVPVLENNEPEMISAYALTELIQGTRFRRPDGTNIIIGMSKQASDVIGIQYEAWAESEKRANNWCEAFKKENKELSNLRKTPLLNRIKFVFTGINYERNNSSRET